jgi:YVTN family beta-propeller protein
MFVISPDGRRIYTANSEAGGVRVLDLRGRTLLATIPIAQIVGKLETTNLLVSW